MSKRREALAMIAKGYEMLAEAEAAACCCDKAKEAKKSDPAPAEDKADKKPGKRGGRPAKAKEEAKKAEKTEGDAGSGQYAGMSAKALYDECVKRGIKCCTRRGADYYIGILVKDDAAKADQDDDWGEEEASGKADVEDDDDEWSLD